MKTPGWLSRQASRQKARKARRTDRAERANYGRILREFTKEVNREFVSQHMATSFASIAERARKVFASVARLESELAREPEDFATQVNLASMRRLATQVRAELDQIASHYGATYPRPMPTHSVNEMPSDLTPVEMLNQLIRQGHVVPVVDGDLSMPTTYRSVPSLATSGTATASPPSATHACLSPRTVSSSARP